MSTPNASWPHSSVKRQLDVLMAAVLLLLLFPLMILLAVAVYLQLGSPVLFLQPRPGRNGEVFTLFKFRSLRHGKTELQTSLEEHPPTGFCRLMRAAGLDELPELWNILRGDMSFVGPRPLLVRYMDRYTPEQQRRHDVRPGLTGLAQVHGRNSVDWETRLHLDVVYVETATWKTDLHIIARTFLLLLRREGTCDPGEFMGS